MVEKAKKVAEKKAVKPVQKVEKKAVAKPKEQSIKIIIPAVEKAKEEAKKIIKAPEAYNFKMFGLWETKGIQVLDPGLKRYISLVPVYLPYSAGRSTEKQFWKSKKPIVERLINKIMVAGHKGKKHWRTSGRNGGRKLLAARITKEAFKIIEDKTKKNPVEVFIRAIEMGSPREGITTIEYGGVRYPKAVDISPQRRIDLALRWLTQGAYISAASGKDCKKKMPAALAEQIILTASNDKQSNCVSKKFDLERQSSASR